MALFPPRATANFLIDADFGCREGMTKVDQSTVGRIATRNGKVKPADQPGSITPSSLSAMTYTRNPGRQEMLGRNNIAARHNGGCSP